MKLWRWVRARRWWVQLLLGIVLIPAAIVLLYVAVRSLQYGSAEKDAGAYVPSTATIIVRARGLERHAARIRDSATWRALQRKILKDPLIRRELNELLASNGAPSLDDLEDERKPFARNLPRALHAIGEDAVAALEVKGPLSAAPFCAIVRLRWLHFLATPFARFILPRDTVGDESCLVVREGKQEFRIVFAGALAIVSNDKALLEQAMRRKGREEESDRPLAARMVFEGSPGMLQIRKAIQDSGAFPYVKWETARGLSLSADVKEETVLVDVAFERAEPLHAAPPPLPIRSWAPLTTSCFLVQNTGGADLIRWLRSVFPAGSKDLVSQNVQGALQTLEDGGLSDNVLPELKDGMAVLTGIDEIDGNVVPTLTLVLPSSNPKAAVDGLNALVKKIAGSWGDSKYYTAEPVGDTVAYSWSWPTKMLPMAALAVPTYAALKDAVIVGSNKQFTLAAIRTEGQGDGFEQTSVFRKLRSRWKELGFAAEPSLAGGFLLPPQLREALNGSLTHIANFTMAPINGAQLRAEVEAELRRGGRQPTEDEIGKAYNTAFDRKKEDEEAMLRRLIQPLDAIRWGAFEASTTPKGISFRAVLEIR
jgi:hypothetical protein